MPVPAVAAPTRPAHIGDVRTQDVQDDAYAEYRQATQMLNNLNSGVQSLAELLQQLNETEATLDDALLVSTQ